MSRPPQRQTLRHLLGFLGPWRIAYIASLLGVALAATTERMVTAYVLKIFADAITRLSLSQLWRSVEIWGIFVLFWVPISALLSYGWRSTIARVTANLRQRIFSHLQRLPLGFYELRHSGDLVSVMTNDVSTTEQAFQQDMLNLVNASLQGIAATVFMLALNWQLALVIIACGFLPLAVNSLYAGPLRKAGDTIQARLGGVSERLADLLAGYQVVRTYNLGDWILARFGLANRELLVSGLHRVGLESGLAAGNTVGGMTFLVGIVVGSIMVLNGQSTFGTLVALVQLNNSIQFFVNSLGGTIARIQASLAAADRILEVLDTAPEPESYGEVDSGRADIPVRQEPGTPYHAVELEPIPGTENQIRQVVDGQNGGGEGSPPYLEFSAVHFGYGDGKPILQDMSFEVCQGQVAAFVGPSGGGKSTIFKLLLGCYPVRQGRVSVEGKSLNTYHISDLRGRFAYIPQDAYLYSGTILENIRYGRASDDGRPPATTDEVIAAARAANAHDFIRDFPEGYETRVGERGARLSGGQRQRIAIARALLRDAPILLLDEATSALDSESEELVQQALGVLMRGRTVLVIAHRLSTIQNANVIYVIAGGQVVEAGSHAALLEQQGLYYRLHEMQFREEEPGANPLHAPGTR